MGPLFSALMILLAAAMTGATAMAYSGYHHPGDPVPAWVMIPMIPVLFYAVGLGFFVQMWVWQYGGTWNFWLETFLKE